MTPRPSSKITLRTLNVLPHDEFVHTLAGIFEHSAWIPEQVAALRPFDSVDDLHAAMVERIKAAGRTAQLTLICEHPELAGKAAVRGELTPESLTEQSGAGLDNCSQEEFDTLTRLNLGYREKFGFPFILAVRGYDRAGIIAEFQRRSTLSAHEEMQESLQQIYKIGRLRLDDLIIAP